MIHGLHSMNTNAVAGEESIRDLRAAALAIGFGSVQ